MDEKKIEKEKIINIVAVEDEDYEYNSLVPMLSTYFSKKIENFISLDSSMEMIL